jgi:hypothetical protein
MKMSVVDASSIVAANNLVVELPSEFGDNKVVALLPHFADKFIVPAWAVKSTETEGEANVEFVLKAVAIDIGVGQGKSKGKSGIELKVPVMTNTKALPKDAELIIYKAPAKKSSSKRGVAQLALSESGPSQKRLVARVSG